MRGSILISPQTKGPSSLCTGLHNPECRQHDAAWMAFFDQVEVWITLQIDCVYAVLNNLSTHRAVLTLDGEYLGPSAGCGASTASPETEGAQVIQVLEVVT